MKSSMYAGAVTSAATILLYVEQSKSFFLSIIVSGLLTWIVVKKNKKE